MLLRLAFTLALTLPVAGDLARACSFASPLRICEVDFNEIEAPDVAAFVARALEVSPQSEDAQEREVDRRAEGASEAARDAARARLAVERWRGVIPSADAEQMAADPAPDSRAAVSWVFAVRAELAVTELFIGDLPERVTLRTWLSSCGLYLRKGESYLIRAHRTEDGLWNSSHC